MSKTKTVDKKSKKSTKKVVVESSSDSDDSSSSEEKVVKRGRSASNVSAKSNASSTKARKQPKKDDQKVVKAAKKVESSSDSDSDSDESEKPAKKAKKAASSSGSDAEDDAEMKEETKEEKPAEEATNPEDEAKLELFVKSLSFNVDEAWLRSEFEKFGELTKCKLIQSGGVSKGIAFVEYTTHADAKKALEAQNGAELDGRQMWVEFSGDKKPSQEGPTSGAHGEATTIFCGNMSFQASEDSVWQFFGAKGKVAAVRIAQGEDGRPRGFCHVEFESPEDATAAMALNGEYMDGRAVRLDLSAPNRNRDGGGRGGRGGFGDRGGRGGFGDRGGRGGFSRPNTGYQGTKTTF